MKLLIIFVLFFATAITAEEIPRKKVSYAINTIWSDYRKKDQCACVQSWEKKVQQYYDGCEDATSEYIGEANELAAVVMDSFRQYLSKMMYYANTNTTVLRESATSVMESMARCNKLGKNSMVMLIEYEKVFLLVANDLKIVALSLSDHIGHLAESFSDAVQELSRVFAKYMRDLLISCRLTACKRKVSYEPTLRNMQKLMNLMALISETLQKESDPTIEVQESVLVLALISWYFQIVVQGKLSTSMDILLRHKREVPESLKSLSLSFDFVLVSIGQAVADVLAPIVRSLKVLLDVLVNVIMALNTAIKDIFGVFDGVVITVGDIARDLFKGLETTPTLTSRTNILKGVGSN